MFAIKVILEVIAILVVTYGIFKEDKLVKFENELCEVIKWIVKNPAKAKQNIKAYIGGSRV